MGLFNYADGHDYYAERETPDLSVSSEYVPEDDEDRFHPEEDADEPVDVFNEYKENDFGEPDVDYMQEQNDFAHDDYPWCGEYEQDCDLWGEM